MQVYTNWIGFETNSYIHFVSDFSNEHTAGVLYPWVGLVSHLDFSHSNGATETLWGLASDVLAHYLPNMFRFKAFYQQKMGLLGYLDGPWD